MLINGIDLNVIVGAEADTAFIWGHGLTSSIALDSKFGVMDWQQLAASTRLVRYDARGHGQSQAGAAPGDYVWSALAADMLALADHLGIERFVAGGQSMGSATALYAALAAPHRVTGLVLVNAPTAWETRSAQQTIYRQMADVADRRGMAGLAEMMAQPAAVTWSTQMPPEAMDEYARSFMTIDPHRLAAVFRGAALSDLPAHEQVRALQMPTLILAWTEDAGHPVSTAQALAALLPHSRLVVAHNAEEVKLWSGLVQEFVDDAGRS